MRVPFVDLTSQYQSIQQEIDTAIAEVLKGGWFIGGHFVETFENQWAETIGAKHCIGVANGTDSIEIILKAFGIGPGHEVIVPSHTWVSTAEAVVTVGATPVFADAADLYYTLDVEKLESKITSKTRAIIPVHMAGLSVDMDPVMTLSSKYNLKVIEDCAQSHLATYKGKYTGTIGHAGSFSFYPTKNLGAMGDAGAIVTNDDELAAVCRKIANHGQSRRDHHELAGRNSRLDALQAAILNVKLKYLKNWTVQRQQHAGLYQKLLGNTFHFTPPLQDYGHVYHLFMIQTADRDALREKLKKHGIDTGVHYPSPVPLTDAFREIAPNTKADHHSYFNRILSLPIYPELTPEMIAHVCNALKSELIVIS